MGCLPSQITLHNLTGNGCVDEFNDVAISFNEKAASLAETLNPEFAGLNIAYIDIYDKLLDITKNHSKYGNILSQRSLLCECTPLLRKCAPH